MAMINSNCKEQFSKLKVRIAYGDEFGYVFYPPDFILCALCFILWT
jgi:hypothetical protein